MDNTAKKEFIKNISDEVNEFHPLLEGILPRLEGVTSYEYTHGTFERGADFVLERTDAAHKRKVYVGVVAKIGKISGDTHDVEEQINECAEERRYKVLNKVRCSEVWVFSAAGYTERAKEKIEGRFKERTIQFFGPEDLVRFVDDHTPYLWFHLPYQLGDYFQTLTKRLQILDENSTIVSLPGIEPIDIDLDTFERIRTGYTNRNRPSAEIRSVHFADEAKSSRISVLEAEMGFGKSKLARRFAQSLCSPDSFRKDQLIPIFCSFKQFVEQHGGDLNRLIAANLGASVKALEDPNVKVVCILDGLDEVHNHGQTTSRWFEIVADATKASHNMSVLITTRPTKSLEDKVALYKGARLFGIRPLSLTKIVKYLELSCSKANLPERLYEDLKKSPMFRQLPQSPIAAALFSNLLSQNQQEVPQSLTELYSKSMELMLGRWEQKKHLATEKQFQTAELVAEHLAEYFIDNQLIYLSDAEASEHVRNYLKKRSIDLSEAEVAGLLFDRSNIFSHDEELGTVSFRHRSFAEFLCAKRKYRERNFDVEKLALSPYWSNVMFFYAGLRLDCADLLVSVQNLAPKDEFEEWMKILAVPSYLLAAYQTEYRIVEENAHLVLIDAAKLYLRIRRGDTKTALAELSEMHLLYLFRSIIVESIAYKFFERAFDSIVLYIQNSSVDDEIKYYALFFLGCAAIDLGNEEVFKYVLEDVGVQKLPIAISLAARMEMESHTNLANSRLLRDHKTRLRHLLAPSKKANPGQAVATQNRINELFERPLRARKKTNKATQ